MLPHSMSVNYTDVTAKQGLASPWTSEVSYDEHRTLTIQGANVSLRTVSNDEITLVQTLDGREASQGEERSLQGRRRLTGRAAEL